MKLKRICLFALFFAACLFLTACGEEKEIKIWVGSESVAFYEEVMAEYAEGKDLPKITVSGMDTGSAADQFLSDTDAGADIFTIAHDNLGKLLDGSGVIGSFTNEELITQMEETNPESFLDACYLQAGDGSDPQFYGVPIMSQALVLYYDKTKFEGKEDKLKSWEGILEVAKSLSTAEKNVLATSFLGTDGYNFSCFLLAQPYNQAAKDAFGNLGTLQIYKGGKQAACMGYGDDQVAIMKYAQRFILDNNGRKGAITSTGYDKELAAETAITCIGGSWSLNAVTKALGGAENVGVTELPIFTLTEADEYGTAKAGMQFHSGSFVDCKVLVKKADSACAEYLDDIIKFLTSDEIQRRSYEECANQPASKNIVTDTELSLAQVAQASYGIPQPFGVKAKYNTYYYSKGAPDLYVAICQNTDAKYSSDASILKTLQTASYIWAKGKNPTDDAELASWVAGK